MNRKVGRAALCAPTTATTLSYSANNGAHRVTHPTLRNRFMVLIRGKKNAVINSECLSNHHDIFAERHSVRDLNSSTFGMNPTPKGVALSDVISMVPDAMFNVGQPAALL